MTVSRKGKRGRRAGQMHYTSRRHRVRTNAWLGAIAKEEDGRPTRNKTSREEWVIHLVARMLGTNAEYVEADDLASDIILELLDAGGFSWEEDEIKEFCSKRVQAMLRNMRFARHAKVVRECEIELGGNFKEGHSVLESLIGAMSANQEKVVDAKTWASRLKNLPNQQRLALEILCGGGNPIDVSKEMDVEPWAAIALIREARNWIHRVGEE